MPHSSSRSRSSSPAARRGAWACSCAGPPPGEEENFYLENADAAFVGVAVDREDPEGGGPTISSGRPIRWTFDVGTVVKGRVPDPVVVTAPADGASCGYTFRLGYRYRVYTYRDDGGRAATNLCSGNQELGYAGIPSPQGSSSPSSPRATSSATQTPTRATGASLSPSAGGLAAGRSGGGGGSSGRTALAIALLAAAAGALVLARARLRRRA